MYLSWFRYLWFVKGDAKRWCTILLHLLMIILEIFGFGFLKRVMYSICLKNFMSLFKEKQEKTFTLITVVNIVKLSMHVVESMVSRIIKHLINWMAWQKGWIELKWIESKSYFYMQSCPNLLQGFEYYCICYCSYLLLLHYMVSCSYHYIVVWYDKWLNCFNPLVRSHKKQETHCNISSQIHSHVHPLERYHVSLIPIH